jgi:hypothetical protein
MTISSKDLSLISNFTESKQPSLPQMMFSYIGIEDSEEVKLARKRKNRGLAIDAIVENKVEEFNNREMANDYEPLDSLSGMSIITPRIKQIRVSTINYLSNDEIYTSIMKKIEQLSSLQMTGQNMDLKEETEDIQSFGRKVITRVMLANNNIATESRLGPANTIICGYKAYQYMFTSGAITECSNGICKATISNMNIIPTTYISENKISVMRVSSRFETGINCGSFPNDGRYFLTETPDFERCVKWFSII